MLRQEKVESVAGLKQLFESSGAFFITDYQGLNVADMTVLRKNLRENNVKYLIAKNTLFRLAARDAGVEGVEEHFNGPTAIAFAMDDPSIAAKILYNSYKEKDRPSFKAFYLERQVHGADAIQRLAELPSREVLLSQLAAAVESPLTSLVGSLDGFFRELIGSIDALAEKRKTEA